MPFEVEVKNGPVKKVKLSTCYGSTVFRYEGELFILMGFYDSKYVIFNLGLRLLEFIDKDWSVEKLHKNVKITVE